MQSLEIISVNIWQILISLCNLLLIFLILRKFLYRPVKRMLADRQAKLDAQYSAAADAEREAKEKKQQWDDRMASAENEADAIIRDAAESAEQRGRAIIEESRALSERILQQAEADAELERKKARATIKQEIVEVSAALSEKMLGREINTEDHRELIDSFIAEIGEDNDRGE